MTRPPEGVCRCAAVRHALSDAKQAQVRELLRQAEQAGKDDLADSYRERLQLCPTAHRIGGAR